MKVRIRPEPALYCRPRPRVLESFRNLWQRQGAMTDDELAELLFTDPPGPYIVKGNITPWGVIKGDDITLETSEDLETARRFAVVGNYHCNNVVLDHNGDR